MSLGGALALISLEKANRNRADRRSGRVPGVPGSPGAGAVGPRGAWVRDTLGEELGKTPTGQLAVRVRERRTWDALPMRFRGSSGTRGEGERAVLRLLGGVRWRTRGGTLRGALASCRAERNASGSIGGGARDFPSTGRPRPAERSARLGGRPPRHPRRFSRRTGAHGWP